MKPAKSLTILYCILITVVVSGPVGDDGWRNTGSSLKLREADTHPIQKAGASYTTPPPERPPKAPLLAVLRLRADASAAIRAVRSAKDPVQEVTAAG
ncbi:hypothetical protein LTR86_002222 [Recurvomyces mirabilis]|nr:hypothetical protein LTR86_002222 [Recurvomyces mirabilis]